MILFKIWILFFKINDFIAFLLIFSFHLYYIFFFILLYEKNRKINHTLIQGWSHLNFSFKLWVLLNKDVNLFNVSLCFRLFIFQEIIWIIHISFIRMESKYHISHWRHFQLSLILGRIFYICYKIIIFEILYFHWK